MRKFKLEMPTNGNAFQKFATNALILFSIKIMMNMTFVVMVARGVGDVGRWSLAWDTSEGSIRSSIQITYIQLHSLIYHLVCIAMTLSLVMMDRIEQRRGEGNGQG